MHRNSKQSTKKIRYCSRQAPLAASVVQCLACWPLVPEFAGSNPAEAVGFFGRKNPQHAFLRFHVVALRHVKDPYTYRGSRMLQAKLDRPFLAHISFLHLGVSGLQGPGSAPCSTLSLLYSRPPYPRHYDPFDVSENVLPLLWFLRCLPRDQFLQIAGFHGMQHGSETLYRILMLVPCISDIKILLLKSN